MCDWLCSSWILLVYAPGKGSTTHPQAIDTIDSPCFFSLLRIGEGRPMALLNSLPKLPVLSHMTTTEESIGLKLMRQTHPAKMNSYTLSPETGCRRRCETRRPRFATQILDAFWNQLSHHIIREWCLWYFVHYLTIWLGSHVYHPDAFLGLRKMHFVHYLTIWLGSDVYHPDVCFGLRKMHFVHYHISPYD